MPAAWTAPAGRWATTAEFPRADIGFMHAIPAMGAKFQSAKLTGPAGEPALAQGRYSGRLVLSF